jgi:hypothetical protein
MLVVAISFLLAACPAVVGHYCCATIAAQEENTEDNGGISVIVAWAEATLLRGFINNFHKPHPTLPAFQQHVAPPSQPWKEQRTSTHYSEISASFRTSPRNAQMPTLQLPTTEALSAVVLPCHKY